MDRRKFMLGLGSLAAGGAAAMGTGAFTSTQADRGLTITTAADNNALLTLRRQPNSDNASEYVSFEGNGTIRIDVENANREAYTVIRNLIQVENQGPEGVIFGHLQDFAPQKAFLFHDDDRYKSGGSKDRAGDQFSSLGSPDNSGTNLDTVGAKNVPFIKSGEKLNNFGLGIGIGTNNAALSDETVTLVAATSPDELP